MGWTIQYLDQTRSYNQIGNLLALAERELPPATYRRLEPIYRRRPEAWMELTPKQAAAVRDALRQLADRLGKKWWSREAKGWAQFARDIATAADKAARSGRPWRWA